MDLEDEVIICEPKKICAEWRYFIIDRKIVTGSLYRCHNQFSVERELDKDVLEEAQKFADKWLPHDCCVMDIALIGDELKVIEFNAINSSGFYDCDTKKVVKGLYEYFTKDVC